MHPHASGTVSSDRRASCPPTRSWMRTKEAQSRARSRSAVTETLPSYPAAASRASAQIARAEIAGGAGTAKPTGSHAPESLEDAGLVREARRGPSGPSYGALFFEPVSEAAFVVGLDLGTRFLRGAICDLSG